MRPARTMPAAPLPVLLLAVLLLAVLLPSAARPAAPASGELSARALRLLDRVPLVDGHNDWAWELRDLTGGRLEAIDVVDAPPDLGLQTDLGRLRRGRVGCQVWSAWVPPEQPESEQLVQVLEQIDLIRRLVAAHPDRLELARSAADIERIHRSGRVASLIDVEGGGAIAGSLAVLRQLHRLGASVLTLTHNATLGWADSATDEPRSDGLDSLGVAVVRQLNDLGMLVDLSHASEATMDDALDVSRAPVVFSHSSARALVDYPRNVPDRILRRLRQNGGLVMVTFVGPFDSNEELGWWQDLQTALERLRRRHRRDPAAVREGLAAWRRDHPRPRATLAQVADHIEHCIHVAGADHVGIGSDFDGMHGGPVGLEDVAAFPNLVAELLRRGLGEREVEGIVGGNFLRVLREVERVARPDDAASPEHAVWPVAEAAPARTDPAGTGRAPVRTDLAGTGRARTDPAPAEAGLAPADEERYARLALDCVAREYPNKIAHVLQSDTDVLPPRELYPAFHGCFDWHSCVHGHWLLARLARLHPEAPYAAECRAALDRSLQPGRIEAEVAYLRGEDRASFERPYGLAWLLQLAAELREWGAGGGEAAGGAGTVGGAEAVGGIAAPQAAEARRWSAALAPLEAEAATRLADWLPKLVYPIRTGEHSQTAFALGLALDWARTVRGAHGVAPAGAAAVDSLARALEPLIVAKVREFHLDDRDGPLGYEPGGQDFLSPCLAEADLVRRVLAQDEFAAWLTRFLPGIPGTPGATAVGGEGVGAAAIGREGGGLAAPVSDWLPVAVVSDRSDGKLAHLDGLNLSRAWMLEGIAAGLPGDDPRLPALRAALRAHRAAGLTAVTGEHYAGGHWLGSFAVYLVTGRGVR